LEKGKPRDGLKPVIKTTATLIPGPGKEWERIIEATVARATPEIKANERKIKKALENVSPNIMR